MCVRSSQSHRNRASNAVSDIVELSGDEAQKVDAALIAFNDSSISFTQAKPFIRLSYGVRGDDGAVEAGINAILYCWGILYIDAVWVAEAARGRGLGTQLLARIESEAKKLGCTLSHLDTFDFQARGFYERNGYELFGTLDDCPPGHKRYYLKKPL
jgi:GNAT superfamily N-acetyltransferase